MLISLSFRVFLVMAQLEVLSLISILLRTESERLWKNCRVLNLSKNLYEKENLNYDSKNHSDQKESNISFLISTSSKLFLYILLQWIGISTFKFHLTIFIDIYFSWNFRFSSADCKIITFSCHVLSEYALLIAPNFESHRGVREANLPASERSSLPWPLRKTA